MGNAVTGFNRLVRGIGIVNRIFELAIPVPAIDRLHAELEDGSRDTKPDYYYQRLLYALYGAPADEPFASLFERIGRENFSSEDGFDLQELAEQAKALHSMGDVDLVRIVTERFQFREVDLHAALDADRFVWFKVNHGQWEYFAKVAFETAALPFYRTFKYPASETIGFSLILARAMVRHQSRTRQMGIPGGCFVTPDFAFGLSFSAGDAASILDLRVPTPPVSRGAMIGSLLFLNSVMPAKQYVFADGSAHRKLVYEHQLDKFCSQVEASSDAIVFIVPAHLRAIALRSWHGHATTIVIPSKRVQELWPVVLPYVAGVIDDLIRHHSRITVLVQATTMAAVFGMLIDLMRDRAGASGKVRYFDLGQVLDVADWPHKSFGPWLRREDVVEVIRQVAPSSLYLRPAGGAGEC